MFRSLALAISCMIFCGLHIIQYYTSKNISDEHKVELLNPYEGVDWDTFKQYKAALHVHTLQSDGFHMVDEVVDAYHKSGFTILALSDHDKMEPNVQFARGRIDWLLFDKFSTPFPKDPKPINYPFNTTWPWTNFGGPDPEKIGMVGIESAEISYLHHMNSFFSDYGSGYTAVNEDEQLSAMIEAGGLVFFNHPSNPAPFSGGGRRSLEWYVKHFDKYLSDFLLGMEISGGEFTEGLWDQLLVKFMPDRPILGFSTDDMHRLPIDKDVNQSHHTIFVLNELNSSTVRKAMERGQFYFTRSSERSSGTYPTIEGIDIDHKIGTITIHASNYDVIKWISAPKSFEGVEEINPNNQHWPLGQVVHEGKMLKFRETPGIINYVRAELIRIEDGITYRSFTNPFGVRISDN
ncbi:MAG: hypothetical protein WD607_03815 [Candidatus Paceibacterota bacterium]